MILLNHVAPTNKHLYHLHNLVDTYGGGQINTYILITPVNSLITCHSPSVIKVNSGHNIISFFFLQLEERSGRDTNLAVLQCDSGLFNSSWGACLDAVERQQQLKVTLEYSLRCLFFGFVSYYQELGIGTPWQTSLTDLTLWESSVPPNSCFGVDSWDILTWATDARDVSKDS